MTPKKAPYLCKNLSPEVLMKTGSIIPGHKLAERLPVEFEFSLWRLIMQENLILEQSPPGNDDPPKPPKNEIMNVEQVCKWLGVNRKTIYKLVGAKRIPHKRVGRKILFLRPALLEWVRG